MPFYEKGDVRIHYQDVGSGFPLLLIPGGGDDSPAAETARRKPSLFRAWSRIISRANARTCGF